MESAGSIIISGIIDGSDGYSSAVVQLFRRSDAALGDDDRPTGTLTYTFATGVLSGTASYFNGWSQSIPAASEGTKLYVTMATARSQGATDTIVGNPAGQGDNEWSTPVEYVADGMAYASVTIYKRYPSAPTDKPADNSKFYFKTVGSIKAGTLVAPSGGSLNDWSTEMPATNANHDPCWVRHATAVAKTTDDYDEIGVSEWSDPAVKLVEDGENGKNAEYLYLRGVNFWHHQSGIYREVSVNGGPNLIDTSIGIGLTIINRMTLAHVESIIYNTYGNDSQKTALLNKLDTLNDNVFVCLTSADAISFSDALIAKLKTFGLSSFEYTTNQQNARTPFAFIGYKGLPEGQGITRIYSASETSPVAEISVYVANGALSSKDGDKGDGGAVATVTPGEISVQCDKDGNVTAAINRQALSFGLTVGGVVCTDVKAALKGSQPRGVSLVSSGGTVTAISIRTSVSGSAVKDTDFAAGVSFTVSGKDFNNKNVTAECTLGLKGQRQGAKGDATPVYDLVFDTYQAVFDVQSMKLTASFGLYVRKAEGTATPSYIVTYTPQYLDPGTGEWTNLSGPSSSKYSKTLTNVTLSEIPKSIDFRVIDSNNKLLCTTAMPISIKGVQGELGKMCYIAGICKDDTEYTSNAQQTVAVEVQATSGTETQIWYLDASTNKVTVGGRTVYVTPENQGKDGIPIVWKQGRNNYNLIRTKYLFADFAKLGEGVVSGDWLFSASGKINGTSYGASQKHGGVTAYMAFNAADPHGDGVVKVSGESRSLAYNYYESDYFGYMELTRGRDLKIRAKGKRNYYSENVVYLRLYLYKDGEYTQKAYLSWDTSYDVEKELIYTILESGTYYLCVEHSYTSYSSYGSSVISDIYATEYGFAPNYAVDLKMGKSYQNDAYLKGKIEAGSGSIGGFDIGANDLKNINYDAGITIQDKETYPTKVVKIGADAEDEMTERKASMVAEATEANTGSDRPYNTALYLDAHGATYNYAYHGNGNGVLNGLVFGFKMQFVNVTSESRNNPTVIPIINGSTIILTSSGSLLTGGHRYCCLPKLSDVRKALGLVKETGTGDTTTPFAIEITIIDQLYADDHVENHLLFRTAHSSFPKLNGVENPWLMSFDNTIFDGNETNEVLMGRGDALKVLLVYDTVSRARTSGTSWYWSDAKSYYRAYVMTHNN